MDWRGIDGWQQREFIEDGEKWINLRNILGGRTKWTGHTRCKIERTRQIKNDA